MSVNTAENLSAVRDAVRKLLDTTTYPVKVLSYLGSGDEGIIFESDNYIMKYFPDSRTVPVPILSFIRTKIMRNRNIVGIRPIVDIIETEEDLLFIFYNEHSRRYTGGDEPGTLRILADAYRNGYVHLNVNPSNLMYSADGTLKLIDIGRDIIPYSETYFRDMVGRAFLTTYYFAHPNLKEMMSSLHTEKRHVFNEEGLREYARKLSLLLPGWRYD